MDYATNSLRVEQLSPEKAAEYLNCNYSHNRRLRRHHVRYLLGEMRAGRFLPTAEIHLMYRNGEPVLVNGQHTCSAIVEYGKPVTVTIRKTMVSEAGQIALAYAFGHDTGLRRTFNDAMGAYNIAEKTGLSNTQVNALATALRHIKNDFIGEGHGRNRDKASPGDLVDYVYAWSHDARLLFSTISNIDGAGGITRLLYKRGSLSIALVTMHYQIEKAIDFWRGVVQPDGLMFKDPRMTARRYLEQSKERQAGIHAITPARLSRQLASCWNAFYRNEMLNNAKPSEHSPIKLLGTPYNGNQSAGFLSIRNEVT